MNIIYGLIMILILGLAISGQKSLNSEFPKTRYNSSGSFSIQTSPVDGKPEIVERGAINGIAYEIDYSMGKVHGARFDGQVRQDVSGIGQEELERRFGGKYERQIIACSKDAISDAISCVMTLPGLSVWYSGGNSYSLTPGFRSTPGTVMAVRIDADKPVFGGEVINGIKASSLIERMKTAKKVTVRATKWPRDYGTDEIFEPRGFTEALTFMKWYFNQMK